MRNQWVVALVGALLLASGCGSVGDKMPAPTVLHDTSPRQLQLYIFVTLGGYEIGTRETASIEIDFQAGGRPVQFISNEGVNCNGIELKRHIGAFDSAVARSAIAGKSINCRYSYPNGFATFTFDVPSGLEILSPQERQVIGASRKTTVTYRAAPEALPLVVALGSNVKATPQPDNTTTTQATLDTSALRGVGSISLTQQFDLKSIQALDFRSSGGRLRSMTMIDVTWQ
jgi:hypothetical protein